MKKRLIKSCLLLTSVLCLLTGCISAEERAQAEAWRVQAEKNAVEYIEEKYGFEAQVVDSESQKTEDLFAARYTSKTLVTMEYAGKEFCVLSFGEDEHMDKATDNYQKEELLAAFKEELTALFGVEPDFVDICGGDNEYSTNVNSEEFYNMFFREYYDGTNLEEVLMQDIFYCLAEYVGDIDLDYLYEQNKTSLFEHEYMRAGFVTYDSRENMELSVIDTNGGFENVIYKNALYVKDALVVKKSEVTPFDLSIGQCGDFYYLNVGADISQYSITEEAEIHDADEWNGHGFKNATFVSDTAYYLEGDTERTLYIYIPEDKFAQIPSGDFDENVVLSSRYISENSGDISYKIWLSHETIPGYEVFHTAYADAEDFSFRFMYDAKESDE